MDGKEVDCNTNHIGDGWRTSFAEDTLRQPRSQERTEKTSRAATFGSVMAQGPKEDVTACLHSREDGTVDVNKWVTEVPKSTNTHRDNTRTQFAPAHLYSACLHSSIPQQFCESANQLLDSVSKCFRLRQALSAHFRPFCGGKKWRLIDNYLRTLRRTISHCTSTTVCTLQPRAFLFWLYCLKGPLLQTTLGGGRLERGRFAKNTKSQHTHHTPHTKHQYPHTHTPKTKPAHTNLKAKTCARLVKKKCRKLIFHQKNRR